MRNFRPKDIKKILDQTGLSTVYRSWKRGEAPDLPYIIYYQATTETLGADDITYYARPDYNIELYSNAKDIASEEKIEEVLTENKIYYEKSEDIDIPKEGFMEVIYYI